MVLVSTSAARLLRAVGSVVTILLLQPARQWARRKIPWFPRDLFLDSLDVVLGVIVMEAKAESGFC